MRRNRNYTDYLRDSLDASKKQSVSLLVVGFEAFQANSTLRDILPQKFPTTGIPLSPIYSQTRASVSLDLAHLPERQAAMPQILLDLPDDLLLALREQPEEVLHEVRLIAAIHYLQAKRLSLGQAARLAGVSRLEFLDLLAARGIPAFDLSAADAVAEIAAAQRTTTDDRQ